MAFPGVQAIAFCRIVLIRRLRLTFLPLRYPDR